MAILSSELKGYRATSHNDLATNGGYLSGNAMVSGVKNNVWPDASQAELDAGSIKYRKIFLKVDNSENIALQNAKAFIEKYTPGDDRVVMFAGSASDIQSDIGSPRLYGCGKLDANVIATAVTLDVLVEDETDLIFQDGDVLRISDKTGVSDVANSEEYVTVSGTPTYVGKVATITLVAGLVNAYLAADTRVMSVLEDASVGVTHTAPVVTSASGTVDDTTYPIAPENLGSVDDNWTLTFTSTTAFDITRDNPNVGETLSGVTGSTTAPVNTTTGNAYFTIVSSFFGGSWQAGDTVTFSTSSASLPVWEMRVIPAGSSDLSANSVTLALTGESAA